VIPLVERVWRYQHSFRSIIQQCYGQTEGFAKAILRSACIAAIKILYNKKVQADAYTHWRWRLIRFVNLASMHVYVLQCTISYESNSFLLGTGDITELINKTSHLVYCDFVVCMFYKDT